MLTSGKIPRRCRQPAPRPQVPAPNCRREFASSIESGQEPDYETIQGEPHEIKAKNINPYMVDAPDIIPVKRTTPLSAALPIVFGSMPNDGGNLLLSPEEKDALMAVEPQAEKWIKPILGSVEFINRQDRYCIWLADVSPRELRAMPAVRKRVEAVRDERLKSSRVQPPMSGPGIILVKHGCGRLM